MRARRTPYGRTFFSILERRLAAKRNDRVCSCSLNDLVEDVQGHVVQRRETYDHKE
jgi:hypothetical protein